MEVKSRKRKGNQSLPNGAKKQAPFLQTKQDGLKSELATLDCTDPKKLQAFFQQYDSISISWSSDREVFTPWQGGSSDGARFRLYECGNVYVNPPEDLKVIGYLGHTEEDIVIMVGTQSGQVYMDEDEIVYIVADSLSEFAQHGCKKDPKFFDYYMARPNDENSLPCAAGTIEDEEDMGMDTTEELNIDYQTLEADLVRAKQLFATGRYFNIPETAANGRNGTHKTCSRVYKNTALPTWLSPPVVCTDAQDG